MINTSGPWKSSLPCCPPPPPCLPQWTGRWTMPWPCHCQAPLQLEPASDWWGGGDCGVGRNQSDAASKHTAVPASSQRTPPPGHRTIQDFDLAHYPLPWLPEPLSMMSSHYLGRSGMKWRTFAIICLYSFDITRIDWIRIWFNHWMPPWLSWLICLGPGRRQWPKQKIYLCRVYSWRQWNKLEMGSFIAPKVSAKRACILTEMGYC